MEIDGKEVTNKSHYLHKVTYVPIHAEGNAGHEDCEQGVIISVRENSVMVLYSKSRSVQSTNASDLVWG